MRHAGPALFIALALAACATGGANIAARAPADANPPPGGATFTLAPNAPPLPRTARIALARVADGLPTPVPPVETTQWRSSLAASAQDRALIPLAPPPTPAGDDPAAAIRAAASAAGYDAVLIYSVFTKPSDEATASRVANLRPVGGNLVSTNAAVGRETATATLLDARTGATYGTARADAQQTGFVVNGAAGSATRARSEPDPTAADAFGPLTEQVAHMLDRLRA